MLNIKVGTDLEATLVPQTFEKASLIIYYFFCDFFFVDEKKSSFSKKLADFCKKVKCTFELNLFYFQAIK
jgi:hypothetical protein